MGKIERAIENLELLKQNTEKKRSAADRIGNIIITEMMEVYDTAIDALREKQERAAGCPVCRGEETVKDYFGNECVEIIGDNMHVANAPEEYAWLYVKIKVCPICGRDLTEGESV